MLVDDRLVPRVYAQARAPAHSGLNPVIMPYFHSTFDLAMTRVAYEYSPLNIRTTPSYRGDRLLLTIFL